MVLESVEIVSVFANPGTPSSSTCPPVNRPMRSRSIMYCWPTITLSICSNRGAIKALSSRIRSAMARISELDVVVSGGKIDPPTDVYDWFSNDSLIPQRRATLFGFRYSTLLLLFLYYPACIIDDPVQPVVRRSLWRVWEFSELLHESIEYWSYSFIHAFAHRIEGRIVRVAIA